MGSTRRRPARSLSLLSFTTVSAGTTLAGAIAEGDAHPSLEELAYRYGTDKSKDDHKFVDFYMTLFDPIRFQVTNVTEIGIATGQSLRMWADYFSNAHVWGMDHNVHNTVRKHLTRDSRVHVKVANAYAFDGKVAESMHWVNESMDIIIDDALHDMSPQHNLLARMWPILRPGGYYIIEDVGPPSGKISKDIDEPVAWSEEHIRNPEAARIVRDHTAYLVDSTFGHRNWTAYGNTKVWNLTFHARGRYRHNSHLIVLRKRTARHPPQPWQQFYGTSNVSGAQGGAMSRTWIYRERQHEATAASAKDQTGA